MASLGAAPPEPPWSGASWPPRTLGPQSPGFWIGWGAPERTPDSLRVAILLAGHPVPGLGQLGDVRGGGEDLDL